MRQLQTLALLPRTSIGSRSNRSKRSNGSRRSTPNSQPFKQFNRCAPFELLPRNRIKLNSALGFLARIAICHHDMDVCPSVGKRRESPSKNSRPVLNLFSPKGNLFDGQCHGKSSLFPQEFVFPGDGIVLRKAEGCNHSVY